ncbi:MAG TPA: hormogonium polysaccharide secretion pseudopilin HpsB [Nostocaceae cyanobacterium]|nr:hormogonium polysaccharide secretion pseudopilin HpsB [Nostocaceae cyanobacterium]
MNQQHLPKLFTQSQESGFTIVESLVALMVAGFLLAAVAPALVLSTATRVQSKRVERATEAARTLIDALNSKTIADPAITTTLTALTSSSDRRVDKFSDDYLLQANAPTSSTGLYCYQKNGTIQAPNCTSNLFYIQTIRSVVSGSTDVDNGQGYRLGIRVYRADAPFGSLKKTADKNGQQKTSNTYAGGTGDRTAPLVEMTTEIVRGRPSYSSMCKRLGGCQ